MDKELTIDEMRILAGIEREMDAGKQSFVVWDSVRLAVKSEIMERFGLKSGQTISFTMAGQILEAHLALLEDEIATKTRLH
ncbi:hypothetical protein LCGC14_1856800 [marine sediment metagenome]|uniref:Uncharacterized protein n=1 Tax=marine sediment metagenome TaxID=412755 RepID=A0A0F9J7V9_9ZZZZ